MVRLRGSGHLQPAAPKRSGLEKAPDANSDVLKT